MYSFVSATEDDPREAVKFLKLYWRRRIERDYAHYRRLDIRRGAEVVLPDTHDMVDLRI